MATTHSFIVHVTLQDDWGSQLDAEEYLRRRLDGEGVPGWAGRTRHEFVRHSPGPKACSECGYYHPGGTCLDS